MIYFIIVDPICSIGGVDLNIDATLGGERDCSQPLWAWEAQKGRYEGQGRRSAVGGAWGKGEGDGEGKGEGEGGGKDVDESMDEDESFIMIFFQHYFHANCEI